MESDPPGIQPRRARDEDPATAESSSVAAEIPAPTSLVAQPAEARGRCLWRKGGAAAVSWGAASTVGRRKEMEDAVAVAPAFMALTCDRVGGCAAPPGSGEVSHVRFFGVYDGHGGAQVADYCAKRVHEVVAEEWDRIQNPECWKRRWEIAFHDGFKRVDNEVIDEAVAPDIIGSTAVVVVISASSDSGSLQPDREDELMRIESLGGRVINWQGHRISGVLAVSRDGLWDVMSIEEVGDMACRQFRWQRRNGLVDGVSPAQAVADHLTELAYQKNSSDNISVVVVDLKSRSRRRLRQ
ncbi:hypothetical protein GW17_00005719 [Ensete ventricosum]|uniref:protein-serine/threonine phosphatase n=1 Tax=Ensete ventricosum TaxID=4639 RepID=A0A444G4C9_ENSVE|nr:hypothetical protein GW17_00005719 [Ensete ventricosum]RZR70957.1 hypothetical protein BHM03_00002515 [Ensete ventricosum]